MTPTSQGSLRLFRFSGIDVFVHWSWFLVAVYQVQVRSGTYNSIVWNVYEILFLFGIVLLHEFGHALACRQVGGQANMIVLWPLGGVAYVAPPQRPGATLWSIAAGPLVNVALIPILWGLQKLAVAQGWYTSAPDIYQLIRTLSLINLILLIFNMLPVFPLDGGQILRSLLWFPFGRGKSLLIATVIGFIGIAGLAAYAVWAKSVWMGIMCFFALMTCWRGFMQGRALSKLESLPTRGDYACPRCSARPPTGELWMCGGCQKPFDTFASHGFCPRCASQFHSIPCVNCGSSSPFPEWATSTRPIPPVINRST